MTFKVQKKKKKKHSPEKCSLTAKLHFQMNPKWSTQWGKGNYNDGWVRFIILKKGKRFWFWGVCNRVNKLYQVPLHLFTARLECFIFQKYVNEHIISFTCSKSYWLHCFNQELPRKKNWVLNRALVLISAECFQCNCIQNKTFYETPFKISIGWKCKHIMETLSIHLV